MATRKFSPYLKENATGFNKKRDCFGSESSHATTACPIDLDVGYRDVKALGIIQ
jgi:hypothetical protein